jgi:endonuclease/exonuclease/phosphatase family metal-dependent hydrolase
MDDLYELGSRVRSSSVDVLALQEVENYGSLRDFVKGHVGPEYKARDGIVSVQSNDLRGIDLGLLSKLPVGRVISHRYAKSASGRSLAFSRDCLEIELLGKNGEVILTVYNSHLKSKYSRFNPVTQPTEYAADQEKSAARRLEQVEKTIEIVKSSRNVNRDNFVIVGDMNDTPDSAPLKPFLKNNNVLKLTSALDTIAQTNTDPNSKRRRKRDTHKWTRREGGATVTTYSQIDYILCSKALWEKFTGKVKVEQRGYTSGTDHYLAYAEFDFGDLVD